jgi:hypothetical protein
MSGIVMGALVAIFRWSFETLYKFRALLSWGVAGAAWMFLDQYVQPDACKDGFIPHHYGVEPLWGLATKCVEHGGSTINWSGYCVAATSIAIGLFVWLWLAETHIRIKKSNDSNPPRVD